RERPAHGVHRGDRVSVPRVREQHHRSDRDPVAAPAAEYAARRGNRVPDSPRRVDQRYEVHQAVGQLRVRSRSAGRDRGGGTPQGVRAAPGRLDVGGAVRSLLLQRQAPMTVVGRSGGLAVGVAAVLLTAGPPDRLSAQDASAVDRGVRIGILYRPGVRPGIVVLTGRVPALDSLRTIMARDIDYSDRFELITLPGSDSIRLATPVPTAGSRPAAGTGSGKAGGGAASAGGLNCPLYQARGADFAVALTSAAADTAVVTVHDVAAGAVRRELRARLPALTDAGFRMAVHRLSDRVLEATLGAPGIAATRVLFVMDGKVYVIDQDGADRRLVSSTDHAALSPAWAVDGRRFSYMEFWQGHGRLFVQDVATGKRSPVATTGQALDFTPAFSPDGKTLAFSRAIEEGTDVYTVNIKDGCCLQRLTVGRFYDNLSPTYSPDGQRIAFVSTRAGLPQIYVMG